MPAPKRLLLVGAGHAHLHLLSRGRDLVRAGHHMTCIAPSPFWYSGRATAMLGGTREPSDDTVDIAALAWSTGCRLLDDTVVAFDPDRRLATTSHNGIVPFDIASLSIGSETIPIPGQDDATAFAAKPICNLLALRRRIEGTAPGRILVAGSGMTACEIAANLAGLHARLAQSAGITLVTGADGLLPNAAIAVRRTVRSALHAHRIAIREAGAVLRITDGIAVLPHDTIAFDLLVNATGLHPPAVLRDWDVALDATGAVRIDRALRSTSHPAVHAAGDCAGWPEPALPRTGVTAVRQGPVLRRNLLGALEGRPPRPFRPRRRQLWIMNLGDGTGLAGIGGLSWRGRAALALKDRLDAAFLHGLHRRACPGEGRAS